jgi:hypothetical protein
MPAMGLFWACWLPFLGNSTNVLLYVPINNWVVPLLHTFPDWQLWADTVEKLGKFNR